jgi:hypothetical protein
MDHIRRVFPGFGYVGRTGTHATGGQRLWDTRVILGPASFLYSVLALELMLRWNRVDGVYAIHSTGQLIPLAVAVVAFLDLLLSISRKYWVRDSEFQLQENYDSNAVICISEKDRRVDGRVKCPYLNSSNAADDSKLRPTKHNPHHGLQFPDGRWA